MDKYIVHPVEKASSNGASFLDLSYLDCATQYNHMFSRVFDESLAVTLKAETVSRHFVAVLNPLKSYIQSLFLFQ